MSDWTLALIKPDATRRTLVGRIVREIEERGFEIGGFKRCVAMPWEMARFYEDHLGKPYFEALVSFMSSGPIYVLILRGPADTASAWRKAMGPADPESRPPDTIRGRLAAGCPVMENLVHGSDHLDAAMREARLAVDFGWL